MGIPESTCVQTRGEMHFLGLSGFFLQNEMQIPETGQGPGIEIAGFQFRTACAAFWSHCKSTEEKLLEFLLEEEQRGAASVLFYCF